MKIPETLELIASDFNSLTEPCNTQHADQMDCPIARALMRNGIKDFRLGNYSLRIGAAIYYMNGSLSDVEACRTVLLKKKKAGIQISKTPINCYLW